MSQPGTIRVFVAATPSEWLPTKLLEFSIRETTAQPVEVLPIYQAGRTIPTPRAVQNRARTPFSFQRFLIPELCGFEGRGIYLDSDMQVFHDIAELWNWPMQDHDLLTVQQAGDGRVGQFSVMLLDCAALGWRIDDIIAQLDDGTLDYGSLMFDMRAARHIGATISPHWNALERFDAAHTRLLHYTDMDTQPWVATTNPLGHVWIACLRRAITAGFITEGDIAREIAAGHVRPSLAAQLATLIDDTLQLPRHIRALDRGFIAPYRQLQSGHKRPWASPMALLHIARRLYYRSPLPRLMHRSA
jgi:hypothetical protein